MSGYLPISVIQEWARGDILADRILSGWRNFDHGTDYHSLIEAHDDHGCGYTCWTDSGVTNWRHHDPRQRPPFAWAGAA